MEKPVYNLLESVKTSIKTYCPRCGYGPLDGVTCLKAMSQEKARKALGELIDPPKAKPYEGAISVCGKCGALLMFTMRDGQLGLRAMNRREIAALKKSDPGRWAMIQMMRRARG